MKFVEKAKSFIPPFIKNIRQRRPHQTILILLYVACAVVLSFFISKGNYRNNHALLYNVEFNMNGTEYVSSVFSFPASVHSLTLAYKADCAGNIIVRDGN